MYNKSNTTYDNVPAQPGPEPTLTMKAAAIRAALEELNLRLQQLRDSTFGDSEPQCGSNPEQANIPLCKLLDLSLDLAQSCKSQLSSIANRL